MTADWVIGVLAAMLLVHLVLVVYTLVRANVTPGNGTASATNRQQYVTDYSVTYPNCGERNEPE